jgi:hypothetical protein
LVRPADKTPYDPRDVTVPRILLTGGCLLALLAVAGAFGSGYLLGRYLSPAATAAQSR